jgi:hypothetical protein
MNRKQLIILIVVCAVVGLAGLTLSRKDSSTWKSSAQTMGQKLLKDFPLNDVATISVKQLGGELNLVRTDAGWQVKERSNYPANFAQISELLKKLADLKVIQIEEVGPSQQGRLELLEPGKATGDTGTLVAFLDKSGKELTRLILGKKHVRKSSEGPQSPFGGEEGFPDGRYVLAANAGSSVALISDPLSNLEPKADQWMNKDFFKVEKIKSVALDGGATNTVWKLARETEAGDWKWLDAKGDEKLDPAKASGFNYALNSPTFTDIVTNSVAGTNAVSKVTVETFDGFIYALDITKLPGDENYQLTVKVSANLAKTRTPGKDEKKEDAEKLDKEFKDKLAKQEEKLKAEQAFASWKYLVAKYTVDPLLKERKDFLADKKEDAKPAAADDAGIPGLPGGLPVK